MVLDVDAGRRHADGPSGLGLCPGGSVDLEDELPRADSLGDRAVLPDLPRPADLAHPPECRVLVGDPGGLWPGALGVGFRGRGTLGGVAGAADPAVLAAGLERLPGTATGCAVRLMGRSGRPEPFGPTGRAGDRGDARLPAGIRRRGGHARDVAPAPGRILERHPPLAAGDC